MKTFWVNGLNKMGIESGDYVLASEAKDQDDWNVKKLKELELEQIKANERIKELENQLSPLSSATPSYVAGLNERIKVLEGAIEDIAECDSFFGRIELKNKALEVK